MTQTIQTILRKGVIFCSAPWRVWVPLLCGLLYSLGSPPFSSLLHPVFTPFPLLSFAALVPLFYFATRKPRKRALLYSYIFCAAMILGQKYWIGFVAYEGLWAFIILGVALISLVWGALYLAAAAAFRYCVKKLPRMYIIVYPAIWVLVDYSRTLTDLAFPWSYIGYSMTGILPVAQLSSFTGVWGLTYLVVFGNIVIWELLRACYHANDKPNLQKQQRLSYGFIALTIGIFVWGLARMNINGDDGSAVNINAGNANVSTTNADLTNTVATNNISANNITTNTVNTNVRTTNTPTSRIALMQGNLNPFSNSLDTAMLANDSMVRVVEPYNPDFIIFSESAIVTYADRRPEIRSQVLWWARRANAPIMFGALHWERRERGQVAEGGRQHDVFNTMFLTDAERGELLPYHKIMLVPFSERMPFQARFPILSRINLGNAGFAGGTSESVFRINNRLEAAPYICYESVFPDFVRRRLSASANLLVVGTNDAWFGRSSGPYQHAAMGQTRSIENGIWMARAANSGITMFVSPYGKVFDQTQLYTRDIIMRDVPATRVVTFYSRYGDWFVALCAALAVFGAVMIFIPKKQMGEITNTILIDEERKLAAAGG